MAPYRPSSPLDRPPLHRRAGGLTLALGVNLLLFLALLQLGFVPLPGKPDSSATTVDLIDAPAPAPSAAARQSTAERPVAEVKPPPPRIALPVKPAPENRRPPDILYLTKEELAAADIGTMPKASAGASSSDSQAIGRAPNGEVLYAAEWAREPTPTELSGYLPKNAPAGYGLVACKTIPGNRVQDCIELENRPAGSRLASAVRQAAWQFRVRPPRKNGKELVGSWVRIRIDYVR